MSGVISPFGSSGGVQAAYQFSPSTYGAKGNGRIVLDGAITATFNTLTCATSTPFLPTDVGKAITIKGAASATQTTLSATITGYISSSQVTISANAVTTTTAAMVIYGTDDTAAIQAAVNAAYTYGLTHGNYAEVVIPPALYIIAGALQTGGATLGNSQITLPVVAKTAPKFTLVIRSGISGASGAATRFWDQTYPAANAATLYSTLSFSSPANQATNYGANGNASIIGGPTGPNGYGVAQLYSNMMPILSGISLLNAHTVDGICIGAFHFGGCACAGIFDVSISTAGVVLLDQGGGDYNSPGTFGAGHSIGGIMPLPGNNDGNPMRNFAVQGGYTYGVFLTEHCDVADMTALYCWAGMCVVGTYSDYGSGGIGAVHAVHVSMASIEACNTHFYTIGTGSGGVGPQVNAVLDIEGTPSFGNDAGGALATAVGDIRWIGSGGTLTVSTATSLKITNDRTAPGPVTPSFTINTAQVNTYWRPLTLYFAGGTGTGITAISVSALAGSSSAPTLTPVQQQTAGAIPAGGWEVRVGPGQWWEVVAAGGTAPTVQGWLD